MDKNMDRPIEDMRLAQIGFLVNDIEKTKKEFARFFGVEEPETVNSAKGKMLYDLFLLWGPADGTDPAQRGAKYMEGASGAVR